MLQAAVIDDFKMMMGVGDVKLSADNLDRLANACLVVDALGPKVGGEQQCGVQGMVGVGWSL